jgi:prolyl-tRNA editing enzyme YbaK/EbsC (Cys-tRNA(Pro) deacylase)
MDASTRSAAEAAAAVGCALDQIVKSVVLRGEARGGAFLFLTAGGRMVDIGRAGALAGEPLGRADAAFVRAATGFAIGGVAPVGHPAPVPAWIDRRLFDFAVVWAAAGTPRHVFPASPAEIARAAAAEHGDFTV